MSEQSLDTLLSQFVDAGLQVWEAENPPPEYQPDPPSKSRSDVVEYHEGVIVLRMMPSGKVQLAVLPDNKRPFSCTVTGVDVGKMIDSLLEYQAYLTERDDYERSDYQQWRSLRGQRKSELRREFLSKSVVSS